MLDWLTGSSRSSVAQDEDGASSLEEPPETPAPLFAVRAFRTAIFGTPRPDQREIRRNTRPKETKKDTETIAPLERSKGGHAVDGNIEVLGEPAASSKPAATAKLDLLASPAKGILLTPGTAAIRRKTVSFGHVEGDGQWNPGDATKGNAEAAIDLELTPNSREPGVWPERRPPQSTLTKTLIELSKQKPEKEKNSKPKDAKERKHEPGPSIDFQTDSVLELHNDITEDLSQPRSRSGQHWKTEYDQYHKQSNREMKKIIKYGQNVKSYAVKKDSEATSLSEKLRIELAKVAAMESKVSKLAVELKNAPIKGPNGESDQARLVSELAQQTALAIRYKQNADSYRTALQKIGSAEGHEGDRLATDVEGRADRGPSERTGSVEERRKPLEATSLRTELDSLRTTAKAAEDKAIKLEKENVALKRSLARVKEEMMSYESRRQAREERLKKRETKHKAAREECEKQLAQLTIEHEELLRTSGELPLVDMMAEIQSIQAEARLPALHESQEPPERQLTADEGNENTEPPDDNDQISKPNISPRKKRLQKPVMDIWTLSSPRDGTEKPPPSKEPTELPPSSVKHDIHRTLKEIDGNLIPVQNLETSLVSLDYKASKLQTSAQPQVSSVAQSSMPSTSRRMHNRKSIISSPRPSMISLASSPAKLLQPPQPSFGNRYPKPSAATLGRSASLMSRVGSRTSTMGSGRGSALSAERAAAAKARLAKRSVEKKRQLNN